ncbi:MAG: hypothetical protein D6675_01400 [Gemmatimonadetes bacterium]|nr:MAG: hypothetical protein D6675_01400 [Gemmatimonadota bacterium]
MKLDDQTFRLTDAGKLGMIALVIGVIGLVASGIGFTMDKTQFFHSYLVAFVFWTTIGLGGLFFTLIHHLLHPIWSVVVRRIFESIMVTLPLMVIFFLPIAFMGGLSELYHWSHADAVAHDALLQEKVGYLNVPFFLIRAFAYFAIWAVLAFLLYRLSLKQDDKHHPELTGRMMAISAPGMVLFALSITFASFDWLMSLDPHWYSTIFGVYVFSGALVSVLALIILVSLSLRKTGKLKEIITVEHYHDLGKLMFAFLVFWAYMAYSQYFLIWYGNIPEETVWFAHRWPGSWKMISLGLVLGHFVIPFVLLMPRKSKRTLPFLGVMAFWMLIFHWVDMYWLVLPNLHHETVHLSWMDASTLFGIGGIFIWWFWRTLAAHPVIPIDDPKLDESIRFVNH